MKIIHKSYKFKIALDDEQKYLPFYLVEFAYKYNNRSKKSTFNQTIDNAIIEDKCTINYKPKKNVKRIVYKPKGKVLKKVKKKGCEIVHLKYG